MTLSAEVALLAAEVDLVEDLVKRGILPEGARRVPTPGELRSGVRFADLDRIVVEAAEVMGRRVDAVRDAVLAALAAVEADGVWGFVEALTALADPTSGVTLDDVAAVVAAVAADLVDDLEGVARAGAAEVVAEARRQRVTVRAGDVVTDPVRSALVAHAGRVAAAPVERLLTVAVEAAQRAASLGGASVDAVSSAVLDAVGDVSRAGADDVARQAANVAHGLGRTEALKAGPEPAQVYASELLDRNTCTPCSHVDGKEYETLADALVDYPGAGGYVGCEGGSRCRGTLVVVHGREARATLDRPGA